MLPECRDNSAFPPAGLGSLVLDSSDAQKLTAHRCACCLSSDAGIPVRLTRERQACVHLHTHLLACPSRERSCLSRHSGNQILTQFFMTERIFHRLASGSMRFRTCFLSAPASVCCQASQDVVIAHVHGHCVFVATRFILSPVHVTRW